MSRLFVMSLAGWVMFSVGAYGQGCTCECASEEATLAAVSNAPVSGIWQKKDNVYTYSADGWVLEIKYLNIGTRSEGQEGRLLKAGDVVEAGKGTVMETPLGRLKHYGVERHRLWDLTGWNFADRRLVKLSSMLPQRETPPAEDTGSK